MSLLTASLYLLALAFLFGSALVVWSKEPFGRINSSYAFLAASLLGWLGSLFLFANQPAGPGLLHLGRENFAAAALMTPACLLFVRALADSKRSRYTPLFAVETLVVALIALVTPLVDKAEAISGGQHVTTYGVFFVFYLLHILAYIVAAIYVAFHEHPYLPDNTKSQLRLVGTGIIITTVIAVITNAVLPYAFNDFRFIHAGTLATIAFLGAICYAATTKNLFDLHVIITKTLVYGILIALFIEIYAAAVDSLTKLLPLGDQTSAHLAAAGIAFTINAVTKEPIERLLERTFERLFPHNTHRRKAR